MGLNAYRDEAGDFLKALGDFDRPASDILDMVEHEMALLKKAIGDAPRFRHQIYDVLFVLFELGAIGDLDLDEEWNRCRSGSLREVRRRADAAGDTARPEQLCPTQRQSRIWVVV